MAKTDVSLVLNHAVVLGDGDKAKTYGAGRTVEVTDKLAQHLIAVGAAVAVKAPRAIPAIDAAPPEAGA